LELFLLFRKRSIYKISKKLGIYDFIDTAEDRDKYWHNHIRPDAQVLSGVYYLHLPDGINLDTAGTEFAPNGINDPESFHFAQARIGNWIIWPGKEWHRPGILQSEKDRFIVAADMEF